MRHPNKNQLNKTSANPYFEVQMKPNFFDQGSPYLFHPLLTPERTAEEVDFILAITGIKPGGKILDIGCGAGRHSIEFARLGYDVLGIDPSAAMIATAKEKGVDEELKPEFRQMRGEDLNFTSEFDVAICLFTTLGQVNDQDDNHQLLFNAARALRNGGRFIVELQLPAYVENHLKTEERLGGGDSYVDVERSYDKPQKIVTEVFTRISPNGQQAYMLRYRLFNLDEINALLEKVGFNEIDIYAGYEMTPLMDDDPAVVICARKGRN
jgi:D-alanine-D-alanine ligase